MAQHFTQWAWAGWSRQVLEPATSAAIAAHLAEGCESCGQEAGFWKRLGATLRTEREAVPESWIQNALRRSAGPTPVEAAAGWSVRQIFDNFTAPLPVAVRGLQARRHCVYELDSEPGARASVEVMVEHLNRGEGWSVIGQVLSPGGEGVRDCAIELQGASATAAARKRTNGFGEFGFVAKGDGPWRLDLQVGQRRFGIAPLLLP